MTVDQLIELLDIYRGPPRKGRNEKNLEFLCNELLIVNYSGNWELTKTGRHKVEFILTFLE